MKTTVALFVLFVLALAGGYYWHLRDTDVTPPAPQAVDSYTLLDVATHNTPENCWTTINGKVYDLTAWIAEHPGGERAILSLCGKDGTEAFMGQHGGSARAGDTLAEFQVGTLVE